MFENLLRNHIKKLVFNPERESQTVGERSGKILLDACENPFGSPGDRNFNRYSGQHINRLVAELAKVKRVDPSQIMLSNGTEEMLQRLLHAFCEPGEDNVLICTPTSDLYQRAALLQNIEVKKVPLNQDFQLNIEAIAENVDYFTKAIILCSPNNPTGNALYFQDIEILLHNFDGLVIVDEAYVNFSKLRSLIGTLQEYPNLIVLQTLSIAWGLAGLRIAMAVAHPDLIAVLGQLGPYHSAISQPAAEIASGAIEQLELINSRIKDLVALRNYLAQQLVKLPLIEYVYPSDANFLLVKCQRDIVQVVCILKEKGILVRLIPELPDCMQITVGTLQEIEQLLAELKKL